MIIFNLTDAGCVCPVFGWMWITVFTSLVGAVLLAIKTTNRIVSYLKNSVIFRDCHWHGGGIWELGRYKTILIIFILDARICKCIRICFEIAGQRYTLRVTYKQSKIY